jgi:Restriction endonuclease
MPDYSRAKIRQFLDEADQATTNAAKGKWFEELVCYVFGAIPGLGKPLKNRKNAFDSEEIDVAFWNRQHADGLKSFAEVLLIECKNWSKPVGSIEVNWFLTKIENHSVNFGILVAAEGITGDAESGKQAHDLVSKALAKKIRMIVVTRSEIEALASTGELVVLIQEKVCQLVVSGTIWP